MCPIPRLSPKTLYPFTPQEASSRFPLSICWPQFPSLSPEVYLLCAHLQGVPDDNHPFCSHIIPRISTPLMLSSLLARQGLPSPSELGRAAGEPWMNRSPMLVLPHSELFFLLEPCLN